jgi:uncharacterized protein (DUF362 family)
MYSLQYNTCCAPARTQNAAAGECLMKRSYVAIFVACWAVLTAGVYIWYKYNPQHGGNVADGAAARTQPSSAAAADGDATSMPASKPASKPASRATATTSAPGASLKPSSRPAEPVVAIVQGENIDKMVAEAISLIGGLDGVIKPGQKVVIKPNITWWLGWKQNGICTEVGVVRAVVDQIDKVAKTNRVIAESSGQNTYTNFENYGYQKLSDEYNVPLVDLTSDERVDVYPKGSLGRKYYRMPKTVMDSDVLIDVPLLKTHDEGGITVGMKNLFGLLEMPRHPFHRILHETICDITQMRAPDLVIVDGTWGMEGDGPLFGVPVKMNLIIAGRDVVAVDTVCAAIMGHDAARVKYIQYAKQQGLGENDLSKITIKGATIEKVKRDFVPAATKDGAVLCVPKTPEIMAIIKKLAAETIELKNDDDMPYGTAYKMDKSLLTVDKAKYPSRRAMNFVVEDYNGRGFVAVKVPVETLYPEHRDAAFAEERTFIAETLKGEPITDWTKFYRPKTQPSSTTAPTQPSVPTSSPAGMMGGKMGMSRPMSMSMPAPASASSPSSDQE